MIFFFESFFTFLILALLTVTFLVVVFTDVVTFCESFVVVTTGVVSFCESLVVISSPDVVSSCESLVVPGSSVITSPSTLIVSEIPCDSYPFKTAFTVTLRFPASMPSIIYVPADTPDNFATSST